METTESFEASTFTSTIPDPLQQTPMPRPPCLSEFVGPIRKPNDPAFGVRVSECVPGAATHSARYVDNLALQAEGGRQEEDERGENYLRVSNTLPLSGGTKIRDVDTNTWYIDDDDDHDDDDGHNPAGNAATCCPVLGVFTTIPQSPHNGTPCRSNRIDFVSSRKDVPILACTAPRFANNLLPPGCCCSRRRPHGNGPGWWSGRATCSEVPRHA